MRQAHIILIAVLAALGALAPATWAAQSSPAPSTLPAKAPSATPASPAPPAAAPEKATKGGQLDINTASADELKDLPGVGETYSKKIVENRPYKRKDELVKKKVLPQATYDKIKEQIIAKQTGNTKATKP